MDYRIKKIAQSGMLCAVAYLSVVLIKIPMFADYLKYDPKDVILVLIGLLLGPLPALLSTVVVALLELATISTSGIIGFVMNVLASWAFVMPVTLLCRKNKSTRRMIFGLVISILCMTATMVLWNYLITPLYQGIPREAVAKILVPVIIPFNLVKSGINAVLTVALYKALSAALFKRL